MRKLLIPAIVGCLIAGVVYGDAITTRSKIAVPQLLGDLNTLILELNASLPGINFSWNTGDQTAIATAKTGFTLVPRPTTVDTVTASAQSATCSGDPSIVVYECGTSTTCATPTVIARATMTSVAAGTAYPGTLSSTSIGAGHYIAFATNAGTCSASNISVNMVGH